MEQIKIREHIAFRTREYDYETTITMGNGRTDRKEAIKALKKAAEDYCGYGKGHRFYESSESVHFPRTFFAHNAWRIPEGILNAYGIKAVSCKQTEPEPWEAIPKAENLVKPQDISDYEGIGKFITKRALREMLTEGESLNEIFNFRKGRKYMYAKASKFRPGDKILYFHKGDGSVPLDGPVPAGRIDCALFLAYTGDEILKMAECAGYRADAAFRMANDTLTPKKAVKKLMLYNEPKPASKKLDTAHTCKSAKEPANPAKEQENGTCLETPLGILRVLPDPDKNCLNITFEKKEGGIYNACGIGCQTGPDGKEHIMSSLCPYGGTDMPAISVTHIFKEGGNG